MRYTKYLVFISIVIFLIVGCSSEPEVIVVTATEEPTEKIQPSDTPEPTLTPAPTQTPEPTNTPEPPTVTPTPAVGTFDNPFSFDWKDNVTWTLEYEDWVSEKMIKYEFGFLDIKWGDECWTMVQNENRYNDPPAEGKEYLCVKMWVKNIGDNPIEDLSTYDFVTVSNGNVYKNASVVEPKPEFNIEGLFPDGQTSGWGVYIIEENDNEPMFSFSDSPTETNSLVQLVRP